MKKIISRISVLTTASLIVLCCACSDIKFGDKFLEKAPGVDVTQDTIFSSKMYADRALTAAYSTLRYGIVGPNQTAAEFPLTYMGNKLGYDCLEALTDIDQTFCTWGALMDYIIMDSIMQQQKKNLQVLNMGIIRIGSIVGSVFAEHIFI